MPKQNSTENSGKRLSRIIRGSMERSDSPGVGRKTSSSGATKQSSATKNDSQKSSTAELKSITTTSTTAERNMRSRGRWRKPGRETKEVSHNSLRGSKSWAFSSESFAFSSSRPVVLRSASVPAWSSAKICSLRFHHNQSVHTIKPKRGRSNQWKIAIRRRFTAQMRSTTLRRCSQSEKRAVEMKAPPGRSL